MAEFEPPRKLLAEDDFNSFDCGQIELNDWLRRYALVNQRAGMSTVFVSSKAHTTEIVAYYALATGGVEHAEAPVRISKGVARHPIPVVILTRLAVDVSTQGRGLGRALLRDALIRVANAAEEVGIRALLVHAKDDSARRFYLRQAEFEPSVTDPLHLFLLMKDLRKSLAR